MKILIDPGHGGPFPGAVKDGIRESDINLAVALTLAAVLEDEGWGVSLTRSTDSSLSNDVGKDLQRRCDLEHALRPDLFVSLHCNAATNSQASGLEVFTTPGQTKSDTVASHIMQAFIFAFPDKRKRMDLSDGDEDKEASFKVLTGTKGPAVLVEMGFITNQQERAWLTTNGNQTHMAMAIAAGLLAWAKEEVS